MTRSWSMWCPQWAKSKCFQSDFDSLWCRKAKIKIRNKIRNIVESCVPSRAEVFQNNHSKKEFKSQKRNCNRSGKNNCNRGKYADQFIETNAINKRWADYLKELHYHKIMKDPEIITQSEEERSGRWRYMWETSREEDEIQTIRNTESVKVIGLED